MNRTWFAALLFVLMTLVNGGPARAEKTLSTRTKGWKTWGTRPDITVPYLTTGNTAFMRGVFVGPIIYNSPMVDNLYLPDLLPVYNLPFWGGIQAFGTRSNGAMPTGYAVTPRELSPYVRPNAAMPVGTTLNSKGN